jgi:anthranilate synthase component 1
MPGSNEIADDFELRVVFEEGDGLVEAVFHALQPISPDFVYERTSSRTRRPVRTYIGLMCESMVVDRGAEALGQLRQSLVSDARDDVGFRMAFLSYEAVTQAECFSDTPHALILQPAMLIILDHEAGLATLRGCSDKIVQAVILALELTSIGTSASVAVEDDDGALDWTQNQTQAEFVATASVLKDRIKSSRDVAGVTLSVELSREIEVSPFAAFRALRLINPSPCMFFIEHGAFALWGATSLPIFSIANRRIIAETDGATRRVKSDDDRQWVPSDKENAEYDLVVSALREDLQGVMSEGSLRFLADREARQYFNLQHLFAEVAGELAEGVDAVEAFRRLTPHGAATGYPKASAIKLIEDYDARPRGPYGGAVGVFGADGSAEAACVIRSAWKIGSVVRTRAGAKIVAGSDPAAEYQESVLKTLPLRRSVAQAASS